MKRILTILAIISMAVSAMAQTSIITLSSGGKLHFFLPDQLGAAINAANPNDTIFLSNGVFSGIPYDEETSGHYIKKPLVIIGAGGENSTISLKEKIYIALNDKTGVFTMEGVKSNTEIWIVSEMDQFTMRNSQSTLRIDSTLNSLLIDRCRMGTLELDNNNDDGVIPVKSAYVRNSIIYDCLIDRCADPSSPCVVVNCYVNVVDDSFLGNIINTILNNSGEMATYQNCVLCEHANIYHAVNTIDCINTNYDIMVKYVNGQYELANEWIGNDGTVVGLMGGTGPTYSLNPSSPTPDIVNSSLEYDKVNKQVHVRIKPIQ